MLNARCEGDAARDLPLSGLRRFDAELPTVTMRDRPEFDLGNGGGVGLVPRAILCCAALFLGTGGGALGVLILVEVWITTHHCSHSEDFH